MGTKICKKCREEKDIDNFNKDKYSPDGHRYRCRECTSLESRNYYYNNRETEVARQVTYQKNNKKIVSEKRNIRHRKRYDNNISYRLKVNLRNRVKMFLKSSNFNLNKNRTYDIIGCSPEELKVYLESQFTNNMSWENYGHKGWHIDHKIPLSSAKNSEELVTLCHYSNLQPLWAKENYKKRNKII